MTRYCETTIAHTTVHSNTNCCFGLQTFTVEGLIGYLRSWSAYQTLREAQPNTPDPLEKVAEDIAQALGPNTTAETEVRGHWPLFALTGTKPDA